MPPPTEVFVLYQFLDAVAKQAEIKTRKDKGRKGEVLKETDMPVLDRVKLFLSDQVSAPRPIPFIRSSG